MCHPNPTNPSSNSSPAPVFINRGRVPTPAKADKSRRHTATTTSARTTRTIRSRRSCCCYAVFTGTIIVNRYTCPFIYCLSHRRLDLLLLCALVRLPLRPLPLLCRCRLILVARRLLSLNNSSPSSSNLSRRRRLRVGRPRSSVVRDSRRIWRLGKRGCGT